MLREIVEGKMSLERFMSKNFPGHSIIDFDDDFISIEIGQEITKKEFNDLFKGVTFPDPEFTELEVVTPKNKRYTKEIK